jgi:hypothetical protein
MNDPDQLLQSALAHYSRGNLPQAEALGRYLVSMGEVLPDVYNLLGMVSMAVGLPQHAARYFQRSLKQQPSFKTAKKNFRLAKKAIKQNKPLKSGRTSERFLLIKAWGFGFWADVDHVLGQLLLAEMTGRIPVVYWGTNSLYYDGMCDNAFELYFEPVSDYSIEHLVADYFSCFPPKWHQGNLRFPEKDKLEGKYSRMAGLFSLAREEDIVVSDFHTYVNDLLPWLDKNSSFSGMDAQQIYRFLFTKYLRLKPDIQDKVDRFWSEHIKGREVLAVHLRGSDKITESPELHRINVQYTDSIEKYLGNRPDMAIFLLTDSVEIFEEYKQKYGDRLLYSDCFRTDNQVGVHYQKHENIRRMGIEIILDTYLAARCDAFIGYGGTNVSTTILHMKDWQPEDYVLLGDNQLFQPHLFLHNC